MANTDKTSWDAAIKRAFSNKTVYNDIPMLLSARVPFRNTTNTISAKWLTIPNARAEGIYVDVYKVFSYGACIAQYTQGYIDPIEWGKEVQPRLWVYTPTLFDQVSNTTKKHLDLCNAYLSLNDDSSENEFGVLPFIGAADANAYMHDKYMRAKARKVGA